MNSNLPSSSVNLHCAGSNGTGANAPAHLTRHSLCYSYVQESCRIRLEMEDTVQHCTILMLEFCFLDHWCSWFYRKWRLSFITLIFIVLILVIVSIYTVSLRLDRSLILSVSSSWDSPAVELWYLWFIRVYQNRGGLVGWVEIPTLMCLFRGCRLLWKLAIFRGYRLPRSNESSWYVPFCFLITEEEPSSETSCLNHMWRQKMSNIRATLSSGKSN
jgi:hypothetical protein